MRMRQIVMNVYTVVSPLSQALGLPGQSTTGEQNSSMQTTSFPQRKKAGQSLVEFVLVMPILILVMVAGGMIGLGTYEAHMASSAIQQPAMQKLAFSKNRNEIPPEIIQTAANNTGLEGTLDSGALIDKMQLVNSDSYTTILLGSKNFQAPIAFLPSFRIRVGQAINKNLLQPANDGSAIVHPNSPWVPNGAPVPPPW